MHFSVLQGFDRALFTKSPAVPARIGGHNAYLWANSSGLFPTMWQQLVATVKRIALAAWAALRPWLRRAAVYVAAFARGPIKTAFKAVLQTIAALLVLFLEWGWRPLAHALAGLSKYLVFARLEAWVASLPPYGALALFAAPALCLLPLKLFALYLFATGHPALGVGLIIGAKIAGTAVVARIFMLTQPQLMQIAWFKAGHDRFIPWKESMFAEIRASAAWRTGRTVRVDVKRWVNRTWIGLKPQRAWVATQTSSVRQAIAGFLAGLRRDLR